MAKGAALVTQTSRCCRDNVTARDPEIGYKGTWQYRTTDLNIGRAILT